MTTPADELRTAARTLRQLLANPQLTPGPWLSMDRGDRILWDGEGAEDRPPMYVVDEPMSNGANAAYIAAMHPGAGAALAKLLEDCAELHEPNVCTKHEGCDPFGCQWCNDEDAPCADLRNALAVARAINGGEQP